MAPGCTVPGPETVSPEPPDITWAPEPSNTTGWPLGSATWAPSLEKLPLSRNAPVIVELSETPGLIRRLPRMRSSVEPSAAYPALPAVRVSVRLPYVRPEALIV